MAGFWEQIPDDILLHLFSFLPASSLLQTSKVCRCWNRVSRDELLWKDLFYRHWKIDRNIPMAPGRLSWLQEYKRLYYHTPAVESEVIRQHSDQVLHVSFSHNGKMFASSSKDGFIKVWNTTYPVSLKYKTNMKTYTWKYTQFSQFNESDTLLLVSGVHFGSNSTSGEIAVFSLQENFQLQARVINKPYDVFGTWYNDTHLLSGTLHWTGQLQSCSVLWLNKAFQDTESEHESVVMRLYKLKNINASSVRTVMVATCQEEEDDSEKTELPKASKRVQTSSEKDSNESSSKYTKPNTDRKLFGSITYNQEYRDAERGKSTSQMNDVLETDTNSNASLCQNTVHNRQLEPRRTSVSSQNDVFMVDDCKEPMENGSCLLRNRVESYVSMPEVDNLVEKTTKCVSLTSESENIPTETTAGNNYKIVDSGMLSSSPETSVFFSAEESNSSQCACATTCSCKGGMYLDGASFGSPIQSSFFSSHDHKVALDDWNPTSPLHKGDPSITFPNFVNSETNSSSSKGQKIKILDKFLIFTQGSKTYTPHQIGIKRMKPLQRFVNGENVSLVLPDVESNTHGLENADADKIDKVIDMHGHIIGLALSPDHRYLYVNCRPWPKDYEIQNPLAPPPIAQEIDIHVIDLLRLTEVGTMFRAHKAYTPNDECFFIFLDVSQQYVASGAEDKHGYIWDRHYGVCLNKFAHEDVVNCVAFSPKDSEILVTVSDDYTIKVWRSMNREKNMKYTGLFNPGLYM